MMKNIIPYSEKLYLSGEKSCKTPHTTSQIAVLNNELKALKKKHFYLMQKNEKDTEKYEENTAELRKIRAMFCSLQREFNTKKMLLDKVKVEKQQLESQAIANRDYAKRIEQKLAMGAKGQALAQKTEELKALTDELMDKIQKKDKDIEEKNAKIKDIKSEVAIYKRALEIRIAEMGLDKDVYSKLFQEIARLKEENNALAVQLANETANSSNLRSNLERKDRECSDQIENLKNSQNICSQLETKLQESDASYQSVQNQLVEQSNEKKMLLAYIQEQAEKIYGIDSQLSALSVESEATIQTLNTTILEKEAVIQEKLEQLKVEGNKQAQLLKVQDVLESALTYEKAHSKNLESEHTELLAKRQLLERTVEEMTNERNTTINLNQSLQSKLDDSMEKIASCRNNIDELDQKLMDASLKHKEQLNIELALRNEMESSLLELKELASQRDEAANAMNEAVTISAASLEEQQSLEEKVQLQRNTIEELKNSKSVLQRAMLEQLSSLRKQLQNERSNRIAAEAKLIKDEENYCMMKSDSGVEKAEQLKKQKTEAELSCEGEAFIPQPSKCSKNDVGAEESDLLIEIESNSLKTIPSLMDVATSSFQY